MILLDELDVETKTKVEEAESGLQRRETLLPPYSPRRSFRIPLIASRGPPQAPPYQPVPNTALFSPPPRRHDPSNTLQLPPRTPYAPASPSPSFSTFDGSTAFSDGSSQTLLAPPKPPPRGPYDTLSTASSSNFSASSVTLARLSQPNTIPLASGSGSSSVSLPPFTHRPPKHLKAVNTVRIQRRVGTITGSFLIDPALAVPSFLLPDVEISDDSHFNTNASGRTKRQDSGSSSLSTRSKMKQREKPPNVLLETESGHVCVDIWIRSGAHAYGRRREVWDQCDVDEEDEEYWRSDWTLERPWPQKTDDVVDIEMRSGSGSISVRLHSQSHQRLRIRIHAREGTACLGIPRYFRGLLTVSSSLLPPSRSLSSLPENGSSTFLPSYLHSNPNIPIYGKEFDSSAMSSPLPSYPSSPSPNYSFASKPFPSPTFMPQRRHLSRGGSVDTYDGGDDASSTSSDPSSNTSGKTGAGASMLSLGMQAVAIAKNLKTPMMSALQFSGQLRIHHMTEVQERLFLQSGKDSGGPMRYSVGASPAELFSENVPMDELDINVGQRSGAVFVGYNDEPLLFRQEGLITKIKKLRT